MSDVVSVDLYWRPGCGFCMALERDLQGSDLVIERHNIWENPAAAAFVRSVANGNETVPTVAVGDRALVNPSAGQIYSLVAEVAPQLLPPGWEPPAQGGLLRRLLGD